MGNEETLIQLTFLAGSHRIAALALKHLADVLQRCGCRGDGLRDQDGGLCTYRTLAAS